MVKRVIRKEEYKDSELAFVRNGIQYWWVRTNKVMFDEDNVTAIEETIDHEPTEQDKTNLYNSWLSVVKSSILAEAINYAKSSDIKSFIIDDVSGWIDSDSRTSISKSAEDKDKAGRSEYTLYFGGTSFTMTPTQVVSILSDVEVYASDCYDVTEGHKAVINRLQTIEEVENYDYTVGYPEKPVFNL